MKNRLAINGGRPLIARTRQFPVFGAPEKRLLLQVLNSGKWWRGGTLKEMQRSVTGQFERAFAKFTRARHCLAVSNGTAALELLLKAAGLGAGDEVLVPSVSFVVTATAPLLVNATPVFVDIDPETYQMDPADLERKLTKRTRAICLVHYSGYPADMDRIGAIAKSHGLIVIEDCAHAHGTEWRGRKVGTFGAGGSFSFQNSKALTCGEGGAIITNRRDIFDLSYSYHHIGRLENKNFYDFYLPAWNYRLGEFQGAVLLGQMRRYVEQFREKNDRARDFTEMVRNLKGVTSLKQDPRVTKLGFYFYVLRYDKREFNHAPKARFIEALQKEGVQCWGGYGKPIYEEPLFRKMKRYAGICCPKAAHALKEEQVVIKHGEFLAGKPHIEDIAKAIDKIHTHRHDL